MSFESIKRKQPSLSRASSESFVFLNEWLAATTIVVFHTPGAIRPITVVRVDPNDPEVHWPLFGDNAPFVKLKMATDFLRAIAVSDINEVLSYIASIEALYQTSKMES